MNASNLLRVVATALVLSTLSFAAGVAGDLSSSEPRNYGERAVVRIPPAIPEDAPRAALLLSTSAADAAPAPPLRVRPIVFEAILLDPLQMTTDIALAELTPEIDYSAAKPDLRRKVA